MDLRPVAVAAVVALAGCGALAGAGGGADGPSGSDATSTLTPVPVPEVTETPVTLPPGVAGDRVTDTTALVDAHFAALAGRSYTLRIRVTVDDARSERLFRVETPTRYYRADRLAEGGSDRTHFADGATLYTRNEFDGQHRYGRFDGVDPPSTRTVRLSRAYLRVGRVRVAETRVDGDPAYELTGSYDVHPAIESFRNVTLRAVVEPSGLIRTLNISYYRVNDGANVTRSFSYSDLDSTTVERPAWVDREFNRSD
jgi:hypothetical protein